MSEENDNDYTGNGEDLLQHSSPDAKKLSKPPEGPASKDILATIGSVAAVVPLHAATAPVKRGPGRPKRINPRPTTDDLLYHAEMARQKAAFIEADPLVKSTRSRQEAMETLQRVKEEMAREAAALHFMRIEEEKYGKDTSQMSTRRLSALKDVANIELEIKKLGVTMIDLKGERFQKIFVYLIQTLRETAMEVMSPEQVDVLFNRLESALDGWEERAQEL